MYDTKSERPVVRIHRIVINIPSGAKEIVDVTGAPSNCWPFSWKTGVTESVEAVF